MQTGSIEIFDDILWSFDAQEGDEILLEVTYFDDDVLVGKARYTGMMRNPVPVQPGSNEYRMIPIFEPLDDRLRVGYGKYIRYVRG